MRDVLLIIYLVILCILNGMNYIAVTTVVALIQLVAALLYMWNSHQSQKLPALGKAVLITGCDTGILNSTFN